jgi:hypothetical protein
MKRRTAPMMLAASALAAVLLLTPAVTGWAKQGREQAVRFAPGKAATVTLKGHLPKSEYDYDAYTLRAKAGQTLTVTLDAKEKSAYLVVYSMDLGPTEDQIAPPNGKAGSAVRLRKWSGKLPVTGGYSVQVYGKRAGAPYSLRLALK